MYGGDLQWHWWLCISKRSENVSTPSWPSTAILRHWGRRARAHMRHWIGRYGLLPVRPQAITCTNADLLSIGTLELWQQYKVKLKKKSFKENVFENVACKIPPTLSRPEYVKQWSAPWCCPSCLQISGRYLISFLSVFPPYLVQTFHGKFHDDVVKWKLFLRYWPFVRAIHWSPVDSSHKSQWRGTLMLSLICAWTHDWANNRDAGDLRRTPSRALGRQCNV